MNFMIFDSAGNAVDAFDTEREAQAALLAMVREDSDAARHLAILTFDDAGDAVGDPLTVGDLLPELATRIALVGHAWIAENPLTFVTLEAWASLGRGEWKPLTKGASISAH